MDFLERWLHASSAGESGMSEILIVVVVVIATISLLAVALRSYFPRNFIEYLEQLGKRENSDRFDN